MPFKQVLTGFYEIISEYRDRAYRAAHSMDWVKVTIAEVRQFDRCRYLRAHHHALICPDGLFDAWRVQPPFEKYFRFHLTQITGLSPAIPFPIEGRFAIVTDVGFGMRWTR